MLNLSNEAELNVALHDAAVFFGLGDIIHVTRAAGNANANFLIETRGGKYMLKFAFEHPAEDIEQEELFLKRLEENDFPGRMFIPSSTGEIVFQKDGLNVIAMSWIAGDVAVNSIEFCVELGEHLARLHEISIDGLPDRRNWLRADYVARRFAELQKDRPEDVAQFAEAMAHVAPYDFSALPKVLVHGDIHAGNCLTKEGALTTILDWEEVGLAPTVLELGMTIANMCYPNDTFDPRYYRALMGAYEERRPLTDVERGLLVGAVKLAGLTFSIWAVLQYGSRFPDEERLKKAYHYWRWNLEDFTLPVSV